MEKENSLNKNLTIYLAHAHYQALRCISLELQ